ncbi:bifunctional 4-hydroxy-2-oxoglutarate aldolase/2-dehydro-3-deoxy-phosphogluconate aldolase [uncultured Aquimarina sp.]|uniref:bifunctional 4-hydroxy-2-oxoglutarate aldolase/2-dehydro-3-deoxy-phosphogluconate aldolase n=1 Tax=uncultured Aquimarina sp. TaxID=575652 RepID=UPI00262A3D5D|nr:bifunctional 4-hydroxy-2-oxoglutarate aldolase/2-dehydro-3-deoxy-phosphogluconate aldolase [uncultured Aquimarina sp.]
MMNSSFSWELYNKAPIVGIVRGLPIDIVEKIVETYLRAELFTIEITMNTPNFSDIIKKLRKDFPNLNVGAGTVCTMKDLHNALDAGSQFIVTPIVDVQVIEYCVSKGIPIFPGAFTPSEIYKAWSLGATGVKVFPATQLGVQYIKDVLAPLDMIKLVPTGGVNKDNIAAFFEAGAVGVGMGSSLFNKDLINSNDFEGLLNHFKKIKSKIGSFLNN